MHPSTVPSAVLLACLTLLPRCPAQDSPIVTAPAGFADLDAVSYLWLPGASQNLRQQTLVGSSHLQALLGRELTAIELRRSAADETYEGGEADLTVTLSTSPRRPLRCSRTFADNVGSDATVVFVGRVSLPTSPPAPGPMVPWSQANTVRIPLTTPFVYSGGTLCVDVTGHTVAGKHADWWMADAAFDDVRGSAIGAGRGCGRYGGDDGSWSDASSRQLVPGGHADFWAYGTPGGLGLAAFGGFQPAPVPLTALGLPAPGCELHLQSIDAVVPAVFVPPTDPMLLSFGGCAEVTFWIPDDPALFGIGVAAQWFDWAQLAASNATRCTVAASMPTLDMAVIDGTAGEASGLATVHLAHVLRFTAR